MPKPTDTEIIDWIEENASSIVTNDLVVLDLSTKTVREVIDDMMLVDAEAAYERQQESLMEGGGGPSLIEQQQEAYKIKRGLR